MLDGGTPQRHHDQHDEQDEYEGSDADVHGSPDSWVALTATCRGHLSELVPGNVGDETLRPAPGAANAAGISVRQSDTTRLSGVQKRRRFGPGLACNG